MLVSPTAKMTAKSPKIMANWLSVPVNRPPVPGVVAWYTNDPIKIDNAVIANARNAPTTIRNQPSTRTRLVVTIRPPHDGH
jgi:phosphatidate phosphatase APP1